MDIVKKKRQKKRKQGRPIVNPLKAYTRKVMVKFTEEGFLEMQALAYAEELTMSVYLRRIFADYMKKLKNP